MRTRVIAGWRTGLIISLLAATLFTLIQVSDLFVSAYQPKFGDTTLVSYRVPYGAVQAPKGNTALYDALHNFVPIGTKLNPHDPSHLAAVAYEQQRRPPGWGHVFGVWAIFFTLSMALSSYLRKFAQNRLRLLRAQVGMYGIIGGMAVLAKLMLLYSQLSVFWIPMAAVPLWVATSFDRRTALVVTVVTSFIVASLLRFDLLVLTVLLAQGMAAILLFLDRKHTRAMLLSGALAGISAMLMLVAMIFTLEGRFVVLDDLQGFSGSRLIGCLGGGLLAGGLGALLRSNAERTLGHVPRERLHDLTDLEQPLLKHMAEHAPGSWEHSRAMANLAEQAASAIGADALLVRVGAYYHDLGKSVRPKYFVENLAHNEKSPHDELEPHTSAEVIRQHVIEGAKILREGGIPEPVVEFSYTHHGKQTIEYFWNKCKQAGNPDGLEEKDFQYPGMTPQTKETAILMLVDSIEAASRTIDPPDRAQFEIMIQRIVFTKLQAGMLDDCGLKMNDLNVIVTRMADTLVNMNHHRIKYPWQAKQAEQFGVPSRAVSDRPPRMRDRPSPTPAEGTKKVTKSEPPPAPPPGSEADLDGSDPFAADRAEAGEVSARQTPVPQTPVPQTPVPQTPVAEAGAEQPEDATPAPKSPPPKPATSKTGRSDSRPPPADTAANVHLLRQEAVSNGQPAETSPGQATPTTTGVVRHASIALEAPTTAETSKVATAGATDQVDANSSDAAPHSATFGTKRR